jgi:hypothetical protein
MSTDSVSSNRRWLKQLAATFEGTWQTAVLPRRLDGLCRIETRHTVYVFQDGECIETAKRGDDSDVQGPMVGMRLVGWYVDVDGEPRMSNLWRPGARAILWRPRRGLDAESAIALTSPTFAFVPMTRWEDDDVTTLPRVLDVGPDSHVRPIVGVRNPPPPSLTRVAVQP